MCVCVCVCVGVGGLVDGVVVDGERLDEAAVQLREEGQRPAKRAEGQIRKQGIPGASIASRVPYLSSRKRARGSDKKARAQEKGQRLRNEAGC